MLENRSVRLEKKISVAEEQYLKLRFFLKKWRKIIITLFNKPMLS